MCLVKLSAMTKRPQSCWIAHDRVHFAETPLKFFLELHSVIPGKTGEVNMQTRFLNQIKLIIIEQALSKALNPNIGRPADRTVVILVSLICNCVNVIRALLSVKPPE